MQAEQALTGPRAVASRLRSAKLSAGCRRSSHAKKAAFSHEGRRSCSASPASGPLRETEKAFARTLPRGPSWQR